MSYKQNNVTIYVKEHSPNPGDIVTQAITYPAVQIELNVRPETLTIINSITGRTFGEIKEKEENPDAELTYQIKSSSYNSNYKTRGYLLLEKYNKNILIIAMGERNTGGYSITVTKVEIKGNEATVYVKETSPELDAVTTQVLTQPIAQVEFSKKPEKITVLDENGNKFEPIENER